ncbi:GTP-binding protein [Nannocystis punicea]|uniref:GTP-binding protein n=1 Tax=Nannocystis punicea TaxID=2995304 RepID=A0ABY7H6F1_9BACT|nr:GTP-binding protein [Nannocystis poenicansa]WAS94857.1 GTP-binding protein [Nannocystis poenicansa]
MSDAADATPNRPTLAVATIGHHHSGKTSLTVAITELLSRRTQGAVRPVTVLELERRGGLWSVFHGDVHQPGEGRIETRTIAASEVRYATEHRNFVHVDSPGWRPWLKNAARAQAVVDALILVVSAPIGVEPQTHEHLLLARALGLSQVVVFLNKCDRVVELEWLDMVEQDVRELLIRCGFDGDGTRIIRGAAAPVEGDRQRWEACISDLLEVLELEMQIPEHAVQGSPLLYLDHVYSRRTGQEGLVVDGRVRRGQVRTGDTLAVVGFGEPIELQVSKLEMSRRKVERAQAGEFVGLRLVRPGQALRRSELRTGQALVKPGKAAVHRLTAHLDLLAPSEHGRRTPVRSGHVGLLLFGTTVVAGRFDVLGQETIAPGEGATVAVELVQPIYVENGMTFLLRDGNQGPVLPAGERVRWAGSAGMGRVLDVRA